MKTLVVCYSKTGNSKIVATTVAKELDCECCELVYDEASKTISGAVDPTDYERVILICPIWAFELAEPMKLYLAAYGKSIKKYSLIVTYSMFGLRTCVGNCVKAIGSQPTMSMKIKGKNVKTGAFDITGIL